MTKVVAAMRAIGGDKMRQALAAALYREAEGLITEAKQETPVDTGALRASGHVRQPEIKENEIVVRCGFGGVGAPYGLYVHENLEASHPVGKAKYLEDPANRRAPTMEERVGRDIGNKLFR